MTSIPGAVLSALPCPGQVPAALPALLGCPDLPRVSAVLLVGLHTAMGSDWSGSRLCHVCHPLALLLPGRCDTDHGHYCLWHTENNQCTEDGRLLGTEGRCAMCRLLVLFFCLCHRPLPHPCLRDFLPAHTVLIGVALDKNTRRCVPCAQPGCSRCPDGPDTCSLCLWWQGFTMTEKGVCVKW